MVRILLLTLWLLGGGIAWGQVEVRGQLQDHEQNALAFANIAAYNALDSSLVKGFLTQEDGHFLLELAAGQYRLVCSYVGLKDHVIELSESKDLGVIVLEPLATELEDVVVSAQRPMIQRLHDRLVLDVAGSILSNGNNTLEVLEKSPGIIIDQDGNISINGRTGVRVYIDGKDTRLVGEQLANLLRGLPSSAIEKIEIVTNPSAKYEAQGNAGIVNILTKKGKFYGTNGRIALSPGLGHYFRWENSLNFNHRTEKWNLYGQYSFAKRNQYMEIIIDRTFFDNDIPNSIVDLSSDFRLPIETHAPRLGFDYSPTDRTTIGVLLSGFANLTGQVATNTIDTYNGEKTLLSEQFTDTDTRTDWYQITGNVNLKHQFQRAGELDIDLDIARYDNGSDQVFASQFLDTDGAVLSSNTLRGDVKGYLNLLGFSLDYTRPLAKGQTLETGWKNTFVKTDNDLLYLDEINGAQTINTDLSNRFVYNETIYAAYINYKFNQAKWNASLGLRAEQTFIEGNQLTSGETFDNDYFKLFPSAAFNYNFSPKHIVGLSLSRRVDRPGYNDLNPFRFFVNTNTFRVGNPLLTPQFTWSTEINYTLNQRYYFALNFGYTTDNLNRGIIQDGDQEVIVVKPFNISNLRSLGFIASAPFNFAKWWSSQWNLNASFNDFKGIIGGVLFDRVNPIFVFNTNHNIRLGGGYRLQLGGFYLPRHYASVSRINDISQVSIGVQKAILKGKGSIRFNVNDIFYDGYPTGRTVFGNIDDAFLSFRDTRYATFTFAYHFGKQSVKPQRRRQSGVQEELNRARQNEGS